MRAYRHTTRLVQLFVALLVSVSSASADRDPCDRMTRGVSRAPFDFAPFLADVSSYVELHHSIALEVSALSMTSDDGGAAARDEVARRLRAARATAAEGDLFNPCVSAETSHRIDESLGDHDYRDLAEHLAESWAGDAPPRLALNDPMPDDRALMSPALLAALPVLPEELQYHLIGRDFVLVDVSADLVVDVIRDVIPAACLPGLQVGWALEQAF